MDGGRRAEPTHALLDRLTRLLNPVRCWHCTHCLSLPLTRTTQTHHDRLLARPHLLQSLRNTQPSSSRLAPLGRPLCAAVAAAAAIAAALLLGLLEVLVLVAGVLLLLVLVLLRPLCTVGFCRRSCCYVLALALQPQLVIRGEGVWHLCVAGGAGR